MAPSEAVGLRARPVSASRPALHRRTTQDPERHEGHAGAERRRCAGAGDLQRLRSDVQGLAGQHAAVREHDRAGNRDLSGSGGRTVVITHAVTNVSEHEGLLWVEYQLLDDKKVLTTDVIRLKPDSFKDDAAMQAFLADWLGLQGRKIEKGKTIRQGKTIAQIAVDEGKTFTEDKR